MTKIKSLFISLLLTLPYLLFAWSSYESLSTPYFKVFYRPGWEDEALNLLQTMEYSRPFVEDLTGNRLDQIPFVIEDMGNMVKRLYQSHQQQDRRVCLSTSGDELSNGEDGGKWWECMNISTWLR
jgi:hypothetical protein